MNLFNFLDLLGCEFFLFNDVLNWIVVGMYYVLLWYVWNDLLLEEEKVKIFFDDIIFYNFLVYILMCLYYDVDREVWFIEGIKVRENN